MADNIEPISHLEKVIVEDIEPISHLEQIISLHGTELNNKIEALKTSQSLEYEGTDVTCENTLTSRTSDVVVKGQTYQNLILGKKSSININYENGVITSQITPTTSVFPSIQLNLLNAKVNQKYTFLCNVIENKNNAAIKLGGSDDQHELMYETELKIGINKIAFTSKNTLTDNIILPIWYKAPANIQQSIKIKDIILLEGDWTNKEVPLSITGIESAGEKENKISILSKNNKSADDINYKQDKKEILLPVENGLKSLPNGVCDTIEQRNDGVYLVQRVEKTIINGSNYPLRNYTLEPSGLSRAFIKVENLKADGLGTLLSNEVQILNWSENPWLSQNECVSKVVDVPNIYIYLKNCNSIDDMKNSLNNRPITVYYELATSIETKLDIKNLDLEVYKDITYVTTDNAIQPVLRFKVPSNLGGITQTNAQNINKLYKLIDEVIIPQLINNSADIEILKLK